MLGGSGFSLFSKELLGAVESTADPAMIREALELRAREGLDEPMFRSLLRTRRRRMRRE